MLFVFNNNKNGGVVFGDVFLSFHKTHLIAVDSVQPRKSNQVNFQIKKLKDNNKKWLQRRHPVLHPKIKVVIRKEEVVKKEVAHKSSEHVKKSMLAISCVRRWERLKKS